MKRSIDIYNNVTKSQSIIDVYDPSVKRPPDERSAVLAFFFGATSNGNKKKVNKKSKQTTGIFWHGHDAITT